MLGGARGIATICQGTPRGRHLVSASYGACLCHLLLLLIVIPQVSPNAQGFIRSALCSSPAANVSSLQAPSTSAATGGSSDVVKNYTSRLQALQSKYGLENVDPEPAAAIANSASLQEAASTPISTSTVTDQYQAKLRQLQQQYGTNKEPSSNNTPQKTATTSLDSIRARMQVTYTID